jgi:hypothetical protein
LKNPGAAVYFGAPSQVFSSADKYLPGRQPRRVYFDSHHHKTAASATTTAAKNNTAGMHPLSKSRVAGSVILNIM